GPARGAVAPSLHVGDARASVRGDNPLPASRPRGTASHGGSGGGLSGGNGGCAALPQRRVRGDVPGRHEPALRWPRYPVAVARFTLRQLASIQTGTRGAAGNCQHSLLRPGGQLCGRCGAVPGVRAADAGRGPVLETSAREGSRMTPASRKLTIAL